ncbi:MAG: hypothetical protein PGN27_25130 [Mycolicibacterium neoaurum]|uniref:hypothetical protein n=1 Tax=Mycolicibacterium neoaurum TaxID=1795 RepID=UPI002FFCBAB8
MSTTLARIEDCEVALLRAKQAVQAAADTLVGGHRARVLELVDQIDALIAAAVRIEMFTRADELSGNPHPFAQGVQ